ncbi:RNA polymerase sigma-70 factor [Limibacter armeniacum]|uniref:RNA polymerase sigma-70 factor n=1 Tax=Limibacter armeniacum TaxID=466084 RepID=UPI002FE63960
MSKETHKEADLSLLQDLKKGSWKAFEGLYNKYWERLYHISQSITQDEDFSKDIVQEIFMDLWNRRKELEVKNVYAYLYQASKYRLIEHIRKEKLQQNYLDQFNEVLETNCVEDDFYYQELQEEVKKSLMNLPPKCQKVFYLSRYEHLSNQEIAQKLQISKSTVENQINKALNHLRNSPELQFAVMVLLIVAKL